MFASAQTLELLPDLRIEAIAELCRPGFRVLGCFEVAHESARAQLSNLPPGGTPHGQIRRNETDPFAVAVLRGQALEQGVGVLGIPDLQWSQRFVPPDSVEDDDPACAPNGDEAGEDVL